MSDNLPDDKCHIPFYSTVGKKICNLWPFFVMEKKSNFVQDRIFSIFWWGFYVFLFANEKRLQ